MKQKHIRYFNKVQVREYQHDNLGGKQQRIFFGEVPVKGFPRTIKLLSLILRYHV